MISPEHIQIGKEELKMKILDEITSTKDADKERALQEVSKTVEAQGAAHLAYVKGVEAVFLPMQKRAEELAIGFGKDLVEWKQEMIHKFDLIQETEISPGDAFEFGHKSSIIELRNSEIE
jgi:hypothetical protein